MAMMNKKEVVAGIEDGRAVPNKMTPLMEVPLRT